MSRYSRRSRPHLPVSDFSSNQSLPTLSLADLAATRSFSSISFILNLPALFLFDPRPRTTSYARGWHQCLRNYQHAMFRPPKERIRLHQGKALQDRRRESPRGFQIKRTIAWKADSSFWITSFFFPLLCAPLLLARFFSRRIPWIIDLTIHRDYDHDYSESESGTEPIDELGWDFDLDFDFGSTWDETDCFGENLVVFTGFGT